MRVRVRPLGHGSWNVRRRRPGSLFARFVVAMSCIFGAAASAAAQEVVLYSTDVSTVRGNWARVDSSSAAGNQKMTSGDHGWSAADAPYAAPGDYFEASFHAEAWTSYRVWLRLRAAGDSKWNDSVWVQFSDSDTYRIGSTSGLLVNLETCGGCGTGGWGWSGGAWWLTQQATVQFSSGGAKTVRIQTREDGVEIDQIVLSPSTYLHSAPGSPTYDGAIVSRLVGESAPPAPSGATSLAASASGAFGGSASAIPGTIQSEDFDNGANGTAYRDHSGGNTGGAYRSTDVDIATTPNGGHTVGWVSAGEWLNYTVNVSAAGHYALTARVASAGGGGTFHVEFNGEDRTGSMRVPNTGGWETYQDVNATVWLEAGLQTMRLVFDSDGATGAVGNFSFLRLASGGAPAPASGPAPAAAPAPAPAPSGGGGGRVRVMTWNIHFGHGDTWGQAQEIANSGADVVLLQEAQTWDEHMPTTYRDRLRQLTGQTWHAVWAGVNCDSGCQITLILSRLPIVDSSTAVFDGTPVGRALIDVGGIHVNFFNVHLEYYDSGKRSSQLLQFMDWTRRFGGPRIVGGDFNSWWGEWWIQQMKTEYSDTWQDVTGSVEGGFTCCPGGVRFDYLFRAHHDNWRVTPTAISAPWTGRSDHQPVIADYAVQ